MAVFVLFFHIILVTLKLGLGSKNTSIFLRILKHSSNEILGLNVEKKTVYLNHNFPIQWSALITPERIQ